MKYAVSALPSVDDDLEEAAVHIAEGSVEAAMRFVSAARSTIESLSESPIRGARFETDIRPLAGIRWVPVAGFDKYMVFYLVNEADVHVIRVLHGARDLSSVLGDDG